MIYASTVTLVNGLKSVYRTILEAVSEFPEMQMVLSVGRNVDPNDLGPLPANTIVVPIAPQIELQNVLRERRGLDVAADIIEHAFGVAKRSSGLIEESLGATEKVSVAAGQV